MVWTEGICHIFQSSTLMICHDHGNQRVFSRELRDVGRLVPFLGSGPKGRPVRVGQYAFFSQIAM